MWKFKKKEEPKQMCTILHYASDMMGDRWDNAELLHIQPSYVRFKNKEGDEIVISGSFRVNYLKDE